MRTAVASAAVLIVATLAPAAASADPTPDDPRRDPGRRTVTAVDTPLGTGASLRGSAAGVVQAQAGGPALKPGFPVDMFFDGGTYMCCSSAALIGDVDGDPELEILANGIAAGTTVAIDPDGSSLPGWPVSGRGVEYLSLAELDRDAPGLEVVANAFLDRITAFDAGGRPLAGWPRVLGESGLQPAVPVDRDGDGTDELSLTRDDRTYWVLDAQGDPVHDGTWPRRALGTNQQVAKTTVADLDGDGTPEILGGEAAERDSGARNVWAWHGDGAVVPGWPVSVPDFNHGGRIAVGDVVGDSGLEVVVEGATRVIVLSGAGAQLAAWTLPDPDSFGQMQHPALGDLDGDGDLEIVTVTSTRVHAYQGNGTALTGWPRAIPKAQAASFRESSPVIGDVDNDGRQDVVVTGDSYAAPGLGVYGFDRTGAVLPGFPLAPDLQRMDAGDRRHRRQRPFGPRRRRTPSEQLRRSRAGHLRVRVPDRSGGTTGLGPGRGRSPA